MPAIETSKGRLRETLKIKEVIKRLPENRFNVTKTMQEVGYSDSTSRSGEQHNRIRRHIAKYFDENTIKRDYKRVAKLTLKEKDYTNHLRSLEGQARIEGILIDKKVIDNNSPDKIILIHSDEKTIPPVVDEKSKE